MFFPETNIPFKSHDAANEKSILDKPWRQFYKVALPVTDAGPPLPSDADIMEKMRRFVSHEDPKKIYRITRKLGQGWSGPVFQATDSGTQRSVAIAQNDMVHQQKPPFLNQISVMKELEHPNILGLVASYLVEPEELWIVTEFIDGCELTEIIRNSRMSETQISNFTGEICKGLAYLHSKNIIHRDIRPDNIFVDSIGHVKIKGFGYCVKLTEKLPRRASMAGTPHWMAPEVVKQERYDTKIDVWSLGILVIELTRIENGPPYMDQEPLTVLYTIAANGAPTLKNSEVLSSELKNFLERCLCVEVTGRATADELLTHPFLKKACDLAGLAPLLWFRKTWFSTSQFLRR
ncbi:kinase-like domain-containing protein [Mycena sanguinolenta]|nr:kinase-like domain-containing protein [Mycena sanguinolenta]